MSVSPRDPLAPAVAHEMLAMADRVCRLACDLTADAAVVQGHFDALQSLDLLVQTQRVLADLLCREGDVDDRLAAIPLDAVAASLRDRCARGGD